MPCVCNGTYMLTGGSGFGLANWTIGGFTSGLGAAQWTPCTITFGEVTETCVLGSDFPASGSFLAPFNTPLDLTFNTT